MGFGCRLETPQAYPLASSYGASINIYYEVGAGDYMWIRPQRVKTMARETHFCTMRLKISLCDKCTSTCISNRGGSQLLVS
jgi:hypothetical protein